MRKNSKSTIVTSASASPTWGYGKASTTRAGYLTSDDVSVPLERWEAHHTIYIRDRENPSHKVMFATREMRDKWLESRYKLLREGT